MLSNTLYDPMTDEELVRYSLHDEKCILQLECNGMSLHCSAISRGSCRQQGGGRGIFQEIFIKGYRNINGFDINLKFQPGCTGLPIKRSSANTVKTGDTALLSTLMMQLPITFAC
jgi:hypothetical protein